MTKGRLLSCKGERLVASDAKTLKEERDIIGVKDEAMVAIDMRDMVIIGGVHDYKLHALDSESLITKFSIDTSKYIAALFVFNRDHLIVGNRGGVI